MKSQKDRILNYLKRGKSLTPLSALQKFGCLRLSARILGIRRKKKVKTTMIKTKTGKHVAQYSI